MWPAFLCDSLKWKYRRTQNKGPLFSAVGDRIAARHGLCRPKPWQKKAGYYVAGLLM